MDPVLDGSARPPYPGGVWLAVYVLVLLLATASASLASLPSSLAPAFPPPLNSYPAPENASLLTLLAERVRAEPFNLVATLIFFLAIIHTLLAPMFLRLAHGFEHQHQQRLAQPRPGTSPERSRPEVSFVAQLFHFLGEVEAIFGIWVVPLLGAITLAKGWTTARDYLSHGRNYTEPLFVVVVMTIAASRPIMKLAEQLMAGVAALGRYSPAAWWASILTIGPLLGSFITEPAAMTIAALLLAERFYRCQPRPVFAYATLGLLFVNISVGGTFTHFSAPPVLMVASKWGWGLLHMLTHFGWKAALGIVLANALYFLVFRREFQRLGRCAAPAPGPSVSIPLWITAVHIFFLAWTVLNNHYPALFIGGFLFYLAFAQATEHHQSELALRPALLVGFFLAGLVVHVGLQGWWIAPLLSAFPERPLFFSATALTAFNDNAAITYLASLVPGFSPQLQYAVVAGAVVGGGLTVIANAPNPAGQSILSQFFPDGVSPWRLFLGALAPTLIMAAVFLLFR